MRKRTSLLLALLLVLSLGLVACGGSGDSSGGDSGGNNSAAGGSPTDTVRTYYESIAALDANGLVGTICAALAADAAPEELISSFDTAKEAAEAAGLEFSIDVSGVTYELTSEDGSSARVTVGGDVVIALPTGDQTTAAADMAPGEAGVVYLVNEDGWKICAENM